MAHFSQQVSLVWPLVRCTSASRKSTRHACRAMVNERQAEELRGVRGRVSSWWVSNLTLFAPRNEHWDHSLYKRFEKGTWWVGGQNREHDLPVDNPQREIMTATGPTESGMCIVFRSQAACQRNTLIGTQTKIQNFPPTMQHHFTDIGEQGHNPHDPVRHAAQRIRYGQRVHGHPGSQRKGRCHVHAQKPAVKAPGHTNQEKTNE